jgi:hypothetical protein
MKRNNKVAAQVFAIIFCVSLAGCFFSSRTEVRTAGEPYGMVDVSRTTDLIHTSTRGELYHWDKKGKKTLVWRFLSGNLVWTNDMALFLGYTTVGPADKNSPTASDKERLFAVEGAGPVVDITDDVLRLWAAGNGINLSNALKRAFIPSLKRQGNHFKIEVELLMGSNGIVELSVEQVLDMIRLAKEKGKHLKDPGFGTPYLKSDVETKISGQ